MNGQTTDKLAFGLSMKKSNRPRLKSTRRYANVEAVEKKDVPFATLTVHGLPTMKKSQKARLVAWLLSNAKAFDKKAKDYDARFVARIF